MDEACTAARVSRSTFYYWKKRFDEGGYPALGQPGETGNVAANRTPAAIAQQVIALKQRYPEWGKRQIALEIINTNDAVNTLSPNTVRRILQEAGLWS